MNTMTRKRASDTARNTVNSACVMPFVTEGSLLAAEQCIIAEDHEMCRKIVDWIKACRQRALGSDMQGSMVSYWVDHVYQGAIDVINYTGDTYVPYVAEQK